MSSQLLPEIDADYLNSKGLRWEALSQGGQIHLIIRDYDFPEAYMPRQADLLIILPPGYPNANPDMFWASPDVKLVNGDWPKAGDVHETHGNTSWQRWSRHFPNGAWRVGTDNIRTYLRAVNIELTRGL